MDSAVMDPAFTAPTSADLVARVRELHPLIAANAGRGEADRRVAEESIQALTQGGIFKLAQLSFPW